MTRVHLDNNILVHIIMLLFKSHPVYRQLKKLVKTYALINMVRHFPVLHFQVVQFQSPPPQPPTIIFKIVVLIAVIKLRFNNISA